MDPLIKPISQTIEYLHDDILKAVEPLSDEEINWAHPDLSNTIGILLRHIAGSERYWIVEVVAGRPVHRVREREFARDRLEKVPLVEGLRRAEAEVQEVVAGLTARELAQEVEGTWRGLPHRLSKHWVVLHSVEHSAYHLGQIQLFKKLAASR